MKDLFETQSRWITLVDSPGEMKVFPRWIESIKSMELFDQLKHEIRWQDEWIQMFGRQVKVPRKVAWYGEPEATYSYSGVEHLPLPWSDSLQMLRESIEKELGSPFNSVLCNLYRNGGDAMGWHSDDEPELGKKPVIASLSLGAARYFDYRLKGSASKSSRVELQSGDLLVMQGDFQRHWQHRIPRQSKVERPRINLTFRLINTTS